jgi:adenylosuccinate lyase
MTNNTYSNYQSPFTWRYGSEVMREVFSEQKKYAIWRSIWVALAKAQNQAGLISREELADLEKHEKDIDPERILEIEKETDHDVVAAIKEFAEKAPIGGGKIHLGATSMDIVDNADALRTMHAIAIVEAKLKKILSLFAEKAEKYADITCMGFTHIQPAEPTTLGYRFAFYAQDLLIDYQLLQFVKQTYKAKGMKGAVGTAASYTQLLKGTPVTPDALEKNVMHQLGINAALIATQVSPRKYDYLVLTVINSIASSLAKFAGDLRLLQSPPIGEWSEPFGKKQVGSSAMPFKRNPKNAEKICSLARYVAALPNVALENATLSYLERTLDDSANKRIIIAEGFLTLDEIMNTAEKIITGIVINEKKIAFNLAQYAPFAASEAILMESVKQGASRQTMHETLRTIALEAWQAIQEGKPNPMTNLLTTNQEIKKYVSPEALQPLLDVNHHVGDAPTRAKQLVKIIYEILKGE